MKKISALFIVSGILAGYPTTMVAKTYSASSHDLRMAKAGFTYSMLQIAKQFDPVFKDIHPVDNQKKDFDIAFEWYQKAGEAGDKEASCRLGDYYWDKQHYQQALYWYETKKGSDYFGYSGNVARNYEGCAQKGRVFEIYHRGLGVPKNYDKVIQLYNSRNRNIGKESQIIYLFQQEKAGEKLEFSSLLKRAGQGDLKAMKILGAMYEVVDASIYPYVPFERDEFKGGKDKVLFWLEMAEERTGDPQIQYWLGRQKNIKWLKKAADQGYAVAQFGLAAEYYRGDITILDLDKAKDYAKLACKNGEHRGCELYKSIQKYPNIEDFIKDENSFPLLLSIGGY
ncbi:hypothetical protein BKK50_02380 [Rodentibacter rarus]|uniref:Sel1 repeat family protein n=1 Tax=Rodentibacter rarus TaxID=1908260 RepID=A0A1V3IQH5_9PAST|nr:SEL1-like repeat protein [Rodentibacter rarus]OOF44505.1 hypothetical protein BKK50_02380 [Rodentibacter rarus]